MLTLRIGTLGMLFFLGLQPFSSAQRAAGPGENAATVSITPLAYTSNSVVDNQGNLVIFQTVSQKLASPLNLVTRVTVVTPTKATIGPYEYTGVFSSVVAGEHAIYAINTMSASTSTGKSSTTLMDLVALTVGSNGDLPTLLPSFSLDANAEIRVAPVQNADWDLIYIIQTSSPIPKMMAIPVIQASFVRLVQFDGSNSTFAELGKVQLP